MKYEMVCGIETHIELATKTKIFCGCTTQFGGEPNTHCCPVCTGQPGALPMLNKKVIEYAIRGGLALNCKINTNSHMDRKNYVYPDLPKAYQISQFDEPLCEEGYIILDSGKKIGITRIHIEEDAGKLVHENGRTFIDYNRGGIPLIEIVSEPDISSPEEAREYAQKLQIIMRYAGISDCKMQEGSMRCDINLSLREKGQKELGTRTETKNINSISGIEKAMYKEIERQTNILESGGKIIQSTMRYDANSDMIYPMRAKENSDDYRYFPDPDIVRFTIGADFIEKTKMSLPEMLDSRMKRYTTDYGMSKQNAGFICKYKKISDFLDETVRFGASAKNTSNMILDGIYSTLDTEEDKENFEIKITPKQMSELIKLMDEKKLNKGRTRDCLLKMLDRGCDVSELVSAEDLEGLSEEKLREICLQAVAENEKAAQNVRDGKDKAINVIFGYIMRLTKGKANMSETEKIVREIIMGEQVAK